MRPGSEAAFEQAYGPDGAWVRLFSTDPTYGGTELVRDITEPRRYLTLDSWETGEAYAEFRRQRAEEYLAIDKVCDGLTERETKIGEFEANSR